MASPLNITRIPAPRVALIDERTGQISREWYRFLYNLFVLTGEGTNPTSLDDIQQGPPSVTIDEVGHIVNKDKLIDLMHFIDHKLYFDLFNKIKVDLEFSLTKKLERHISNYLRGYK